MSFLLIETPDGQDKKFPLETDRVVLGRSDDAEVVLADTRASRRHAILRRHRNGQWMLRDLGSSNKTLFNGRPVSSHILRDGDAFTIGRTRICFSDQADQPQQAVTAPQAASSAKPTSCPQCKTPVASDAVLCVNCGVNFRTGNKLGTLATRLANKKHQPNRLSPLPDQAPKQPLACPCCEQLLAGNAKICVKCGIDVNTGRAVMTIQTSKLDDIYMYVEGIVRWVSWILWMGLYPIASEAFGLRKPWVTRGIAGATVLISIWFLFACMYRTNPSRSMLNLMQWNGSAVAREAQTDALRKELKDDGLSEEYIDFMLEQLGISATGEFHSYQLITSAFLHAGWLHLFGNMVFLMVIGSRVNSLVGNGLTLVLYPVLAVASGLAHMISTAGQPLGASLGASGAVMGLAGMYLVLMPTPKVHMVAWFRWIFWLRFKAFPVRGFWVVLFYIAFDVIYTVFGLESNVAHWAHLGGFLAGAAVALILLLLRLVNARGGDIVSAILGKRAWALVGKPNRPAVSLW